MTAITTFTKARFIVLPTLAGVKIDEVVVPNATMLPRLGEAIEMRDQSNGYHRLYIRSIVWHVTVESIEATVYCSKSKWHGSEERTRT